jgi:hypothetical protein
MAGAQEGKASAQPAAGGGNALEVANARCAKIKQTYENCFRAWYADKFMKGDVGGLQCEVREKRERRAGGRARAGAPRAPLARLPVPAEARANAGTTTDTRPRSLCFGAGPHPVAGRV